MPDVDMAPLPGNLAALRQSLEAQVPSSDTPTTAALTGALVHATDYKNAHPMRWSTRKRAPVGEGSFSVAELVVVFGTVVFVLFVLFVSLLLDFMVFLAVFRADLVGSLGLGLDPTTRGREQID